MKKRVLIIGCGAHGRIVAETISLEGRYEVAGFADDDPAKAGQVFGPWKVLGNWREIRAEAFFVAIGQNSPRQRIFEELFAQGREIITVIHPRAFVSPNAKVFSGTVVFAGAVISAGATIGHDAIINIGAAVDHDAEIGDHCHIAPHATVGNYARIAPGEIVRPGEVRLHAK